MAFPEFESDKKKLLFFCRGRGRGHAIPDIEIVRELAEMRDDIDVRFVSYSTGARALEEAGYKLIDLALPEGGAAAEMTALAGKLIGGLKPDLVVSHEEFAPMPVAKIFDQPALFVIDWFVEAETYAMHCLKFADEILFLQREGLHDEPPYLKGKVSYFGRMRRKFEYTRADRPTCRAQLGLKADDFVIGVIPGRFATESRAPIEDLLIPAFDALKHTRKHMVWLAGADFDGLTGKLSPRSDVTVMRGVTPPERLMAASDLVVAKANTGSTLEVTSLGVPVVAITQGDDSVADRVLARSGGVLLLDRRDSDSRQLCSAIEQQASVSIEPLLEGEDVAARVAARISELLTDR